MSDQQQKDFNEQALRHGSPNTAYTIGVVEGGESMAERHAIPVQPSGSGGETVPGVVLPPTCPTQIKLEPQGDSVKTPPPGATVTTVQTGAPISATGTTAAQAEQREALGRTTDNTAGYDAGTASRGGGTGGTTEAMTGGIASGGALGDERRGGMGDLSSGQM